MELTNEQWDRIEPVISSLTPKKDPRGRHLRDPREVLNGIMWILRTGAPWKDLPLRYPPYQTCYRRFQQWVRQGIFQRIIQELAEDLDERGKIDIREAFIDVSINADLRLSIPEFIIFPYGVSVIPSKIVYYSLPSQ